MAEYGGKQRNQLSKVTGSSESKDVQLKRFIDNRPQAVSQMNLIRSIQKKPNNTGLPDNLKSGVENLSGYSMDDVKVHYNSDKPAQLNALAYAQGTDIHVAPGQEKHLPHEAWHVVQQKQGRVQPTIQLQGTNVNDNEGLEKEANVMGKRINSKFDSPKNGKSEIFHSQFPTIQMIEKDAVKEFYEKTKKDYTQINILYEKWKLKIENNEDIEEINEQTDGEQVYKKAFEKLDNPVMLEIGYFTDETIMTFEDAYDALDSKKEDLLKRAFNVLKEIDNDNLTLDFSNQKLRIIHLIEKDTEQIDDFIAYINTIFDGVKQYLKIIGEKVESLPDGWKSSFNDIDTKKIRINTFEADLHGNLPPMKIQIGDRAFVLKDRSGKADTLVTELFGKINSILGNNDLPFYHQHSLGDKGLLSEFIEGIHPSSHASDELKDKKDFKFLEYIASQIGLTDLHRENVIIKDEKAFPVDLEAFEFGKATGLYGETQIAPKFDIDDFFNADDLQKEKKKAQIVKLISEYKAEIESFPKRIVLVPTIDFYDIWRENQEEEDLKSNMCNKIKDSLTARSYSINEANLNIALTNIFEYKNYIPMFIKQNNKIFMVKPGTEDMIEIA